MDDLKMTIKGWLISLVPFQTIFYLTYTLVLSILLIYLYDLFRFRAGQTKAWHGNLLNSAMWLVWLTARVRFGDQYSKFISRWLTYGYGSYVHFVNKFIFLFKSSSNFSSDNLDALKTIGHEQIWLYPDGTALFHSKATIDTWCFVETSIYNK